MVTTTRTRPTEPDALASASIAANLTTATCQAAINQLRSVKGAYQTLPSSSFLPWIDGQIASVQKIMSSITLPSVQQPRQAAAPGAMVGTPIPAKDRKPRRARKAGAGAANRGRGRPRANGSHAQPAA